MEYSEIIYEGVRISLASTPSQIHAFLHVESIDKDVATQFAILLKSAEFISQTAGMPAVFKRYYLSDATNQRCYLPDEADCARSVIQQSPLDGSKCALMIIFNKDADFRNCNGGIWKDSKGRVWIGDNENVHPSDSKALTISYLENLTQVLLASGGYLRDHCVRTWFFVRDIDNNYAGVVDGRNEVFDREGLSPATHYIASTGIAGSMPDPKLIVGFNAYADVTLHEDQISYLYGRSHLNPTYEYGVAFERGTAINYPDRREVFISGTASIDNKGRIVAPGDIKAQTLRMLENIEVLLKEAGCDFHDVAHGVVYLRDTADYSIVKKILSDSIPNIPCVIVLAPVCRPGWLIEMECMAVKELSK